MQINHDINEPYITLKVILLFVEVNVCIKCMVYVQYHVHHRTQEYIIGKEESILLHYGIVLRHFTGFMTFIMIFTKKWFHST